MLKKSLSTKLDVFSNYSLPLLILRLGIGIPLIANHGWGKLMNILSGNFQFSDPIGLGPELSLILAAFAEVICSLLVCLGLGTRFASAVNVINFIVIFFIANASDSFGEAEASFLFLIAFIALTLFGSGRYSLDHILFNKNEH